MPVIGTSQPGAVGGAQHHLAGQVVRVGEHVGGGVDPPGGHAVLGEEPRAARRRRAPAVHSRDDARRARRCSRRARRGWRSASSVASSGWPIASHSRANTESALPAIRTSAAVGGRVRRSTARRRAACRRCGRGRRRRARSRPSSTPSARRPPRRSRRRPPGPRRCASRSRERGERADHGEHAASESPRLTPAARRRPVGVAGRVADAADRLADRCRSRPRRARGPVWPKPETWTMIDAGVARAQRRRSRGPTRSSVPGRKFSSTTSHCAASRPHERRGPLGRAGRARPTACCARSPATRGCRRRA